LPEFFFAIECHWFLHEEGISSWDFCQYALCEFFKCFVREFRGIQVLFCGEKISFFTIGIGVSYSIYNMKKLRSQHGLSWQWTSLW
jgi:hypothetical protein